MDGRIWFITGISRGLGRALAEAALERGGTVIGTTRDGASDIVARTGALHVLPLDMRDAAAIAPTMERAFAIAGRIDVLVNNAGYGLLGPVEAAGDAELEQLFAVNLHGPLGVLRASLPRLRRQGRGHVVNISSVAALAPSAGAGVYAASKAALDALSRSLALELAPFGIWVTIVSPGSFRTEFLSERSVRLAEAAVADYAADGQLTDQYLRRSGRQPGDPARAAAVIVDAVEADEPPLDLVLGRDALDRVRARLDRFEEEMARWAEQSCATAYPPGQ